MDHSVVSRDAWIDARKNALVKEKEFTRLRDALSQARSDLHLSGSSGSPVICASDYFSRIARHRR